MHTIITIIIIIISCSITGRPVLFGSGKTKSETLIFKSRGTERRLHLNLHGPIPHSNSNKQMNKYYLEGWLTHKVGQRCDTATGQKHPTARRGPLSDCPVSDPPASLLPAPYNMPPVSVQDTDQTRSALHIGRGSTQKDPSQNWPRQRGVCMLCLSVRQWRYLPRCDAEQKKIQHHHHHHHST